jgi:hypothetical protein
MSLYSAERYNEAKNKLSASDESSTHASNKLSASDESPK